jgi:DNA (cytosine-5)-methyltransferase 1
MADGSKHSRALPFDHELVVDLFAGGGGASTGIARAYREPDVAVNHDKVAIAVHRANHPATEHHQTDVFEVDPITATRGRPVGLLWASPDCRHHSKAKGGAPRSKRIRGLAWVLVRWALACSPRMIELENVEEFQAWGPLDDDGHPIKARAGETFDAFIAVMTSGIAADHPAIPEILEFLGDPSARPALVRGMGYSADWREIRACDKGAPTIRKRLVVKFRRDGRPITWSADTHGAPGNPAVKAGKLKPWRTAAECIDWTLPACSIFADRDEARAWARARGLRGIPQRPLKPATMRRIARGIWRHVLTAAEPFVVPLRGTSEAHTSTHGVDAPLSTVTGGGTHHALAAPVLTAFGQNAIGSRLDEPAQTALAGATRFGLAAATVTAFLEQANGGFYDGSGRDLRQPTSTVLQTGSHQQLVTACLVKYYRNEKGGIPLAEPMHTVPTKDRMGLVQCGQVPADILTPEMRARARQVALFLHEHLPEHFPAPADLVLVGDRVMVDITLRMLVPVELARAQGFPDTYILDRGLFETEPGSGQFEWRLVNKTDQVRLIGNSVCPDMAAAEVANDLAALIDLYRRTAA